MLSLSARRAFAALAATTALALAAPGVADAASSPTFATSADWLSQNANAPQVADFNTGTTFSSTVGGLQGFVTDGVTAYASDGRILYRGPVNGSRPMSGWIYLNTTHYVSTELLMMRGTVYYANPAGYLYRVNMSTGASTQVASGLGKVYDLATDGTNIYATDDTLGATNGLSSIHKVTIATTSGGTTYTVSQVWTGLTDPSTINVDSAGTIWTTTIDPVSNCRNVVTRTASGVVTTVPVPAVDCAPIGLIGTATSVYVVDNLGQMAVVNRSTYATQAIPAASPASSVQHVATDGTAIYEAFQSSVEKFTA